MEEVNNELNSMGVTKKYSISKWFIWQIIMAQGLYNSVSFLCPNNDIDGISFLAIRIRTNVRHVKIARQNWNK